MPTTLPYSSRSEFFEPIRKALRAAGGELSNPVRVSLRAGGYARDAHVFIRRDDPRYFVTDWESNQPTRFSARCRAAATVLQQNGYEGRYRIRHEDGTLTIEPA